MQFEDLRLSEPLLRAVKAEGYLHPTPIQEQAIPHAMAGRDVMGCAQTGTGKTAAFALPVLHRLSAALRHAHAPGHRVIRTLVLTPTRELATQIGDCFAAYGRHTGLRHTVIFGGVSQVPQTQALRHGIDILVATPGRLLDLMNQGLVDLRKIEIFVLDEADRMLDMGFIPDVRRIVSALPAARQTLFFSATLPPDIQRLAGAMVTNPVRVAVAPAATTVDAVDQRVYFVEHEAKRDLLVHLLRDPTITRALVFTRTKHRADRVCRHLHNSGIRAQAIHGDKSQGARETALAHFKTGEVRVLVATDIAARGLDVDNVSHVFNLDLPSEPESYVHRIGRTARAGAAGIAVAFCSTEERGYLTHIERLIRKEIAVVREHPFLSHGRPAYSHHGQRTTNAPLGTHSSHGARAPQPQHSQAPQRPGQGAGARHGLGDDRHRGHSRRRR
jgi:ATP-dependent RNA helicase RhlE